MLKFDKKTIFSQEYLRKQFDAKNPMSKLVSKRKKAPHKALHMWNYNRMHQKDIFFSEPLVHGMCTSLQNTHKAEFPQDMAAQGMDAQGMAAQGT
jgi:cohesin complex subunit SCC1